LAISRVSEFETANDVGIPGAIITRKRLAAFIFEPVMLSSRRRESPVHFERLAVWTIERDWAAPSNPRMREARAARMRRRRFMDEG
jgi:hypothetical protein